MVFAFWGWRDEDQVPVEDAEAGSGAAESDRLTARPPSPGRLALLTADVERRRSGGRVLGGAAVAAASAAAAAAYLAACLEAPAARRRRSCWRGLAAVLCFAAAIAVPAALWGPTVGCGYTGDCHLPRGLQLEQAMQLAVHRVLEHEQHRWDNAAISFAFYSPDTSVAIAKGYSDVPGRVPAQPSDLYLYGSAVKMVTGAAVLRHIERGAFALNDRVAPLVDPLLKKEANSSLAAIFGARRVANLTVRHLLDMSSGLADWDVSAVRELQNAYPTLDIDPVTLLGIAADLPSECDAPPGSDDCLVYSSTNYIILGYLLAAQAGASAWDRLDQNEMLAGLGLSATHFAVHGPAAQFNSSSARMCHGYEPSNGGWGVLGTDVYGTSALNGWTSGNLVSRPSDMARLVYALYSGGGRVLRADTAARMTADFRALIPDDDGWECSYGLATMLLDDGTNFARPGRNLGPLWGHGGTSYGFYSTTGYNPKYGFAYSIATNEETEVFQENLNTTNHLVYASIMDIMVNLYPEV